MGEYAGSITFGRSCNLDKERIKMALKGKLVCGENEGGFLYADASREECEQFILSAYDNVVYHALQVQDAGRAVERWMREQGIRIPLQVYIQYAEEERKRFDDYIYEN